MALMPTPFLTWRADKDDEVSESVCINKSISVPLAGTATATGIEWLETKMGSSPNARSDQLLKERTNLSSLPLKTSAEACLLN